MVFCFALVLVQQYQSETRTAATAKKQAYNKSHRKLSPSSSLTPIAPLTPVAVAKPTPATASTANPKVSAPPQPSKASGSAVQGAAQNSKPTESTVYKVAKPVKQKLNNLLP